MGEENKIRDAADAIKGVVEAVPIYQDVIQPAAKEIGMALQTVAKTIHIALAPIAAAVWGYETIRDYLSEALTERLKNIPRERIITPALNVAGPAVEALRFAHELALREMYATLLATSMDAETAKNAHPAFVDIIRQMVADEARIFNLIVTDGYVHISPIALLVQEGNNEATEPLGVSKYNYLAHKSKCIYPELIPSYLDNLRRLGVTQHREDGWHSVLHHPDGTIRHVKAKEMSFTIPFKDEGLITMVKWFLDSQHKRREKEILDLAIFFEIVTPTDFGRQFANACVLTPEAK
jgi:Abortive infection alpha